MSAAERDKRDLLEQHVQGEDLDQAVMALMELAAMDVVDGRLDDAEAAYGEVIATRHEGQAGRAAFELALLLEQRGDPVKARAVYQFLLTAGMTDYAGPAVCAMRRLTRSAE